MKSQSVAALSSLALLAFLPFSQQANVPTITLNTGATEFAEPFTEIRGLAELRDGRALAFDVQEKEIRLLDFARNTATQAARTGAGPLEFSPVGMFLTGVSDSAIYYDAGQRRFLVFSPSGAPVRTVPYGPTSAIDALNTPQPVFVDASGRVYGQSSGMRTPAGQSTAQMPLFEDSVTIVRHDFRTGKTDTLTRARAPMAQARPRMEMIAGGVKAVITARDFRSTDTWAALPDGRLALLRNGDYRVRFLAGTSETMGPPVPHTLVTLTPAMRRESMDTARSQIQAAMARTNKAMQEMAARAGGAAAPQMPSVQVEVLEPTTWATHLPPYNAVQAAPDGTIWVHSMQSVSDASTSWDVLSPAGALTMRVRLAPGEKFVALGRGTIYTVRTDKDDLQYLRRYTVPARR